MTSKHLNGQFKQAIYEALHSNPSDRAIMRAWSRRQRFPVAHWVENLETLHISAIAKHKKHSKQGHHCKANSSVRMSFSTMSRDSTQTIVQPAELSTHLYTPNGPAYNRPEFHRRGQLQNMSLFCVDRGYSSADEGSAYSVDGHATSDSQRPRHVPRSISSATYTCRELSRTPPITRSSGNESLRNSTSFSLEASSQNASALNDQNRSVPEDAISHLSLREQNRISSSLSLLSVENIIREDQTFNLQKVKPFFTDSSGQYSQKFEKRLRHLNGKNSDDQLCIERYLSRSEMEWFKKYHDLKLGRSSSGASASAASSVLANRASFNEDTDGGSTPNVPGSPVVEANSSEEELKLHQGYVPPSGLKRIMLYRMGDWPVYSIFLAFVGDEIQ
jgi:alpha-1,3-glucan synthase